jgi:hypothetical protein
MWNYSQIHFASMNCTLSIRLPRGITRNRISIYICRIESVVSLHVVVNAPAAYTKQVMSCVNVWLYSYIHRFYYQKYCWQLFYISKNLGKLIRNNITVKNIPLTGFEPSTYVSRLCFKPLRHWGLYTALSMVNVYSVSLVMGT